MTNGSYKVNIENGFVTKKKKNLKKQTFNFQMNIIATEETLIVEIIINLA